MMRALITKAAGMGVQIFNNCQVLQTSQAGNGHTLETNQGNIKASAVIVATNAFANQLLPELDVTSGRGQVMVTEPLNNLKLKGTFHYNAGYTYFLNIENRVLLGGFRDLDMAAEQTTMPGLTDVVQTALENLLHETILPGQTPKIEYRWSGVMGFGPGLKPIVQEVRPKVYCAVRCNGMGIAMGSLLGEQVADLVSL